MYYFEREQTWQKDLIRKIAKEQNVDIRVVRTLVYYPLLYLKRRMQNMEDETPVRIRRLGVWDLKTTATKKQNVTKL